MHVTGRVLTVALILLPASVQAQDYCDTLDLQALNAECAQSSDAQTLVDIPGLPTEGKDALVFDANRFSLLTLDRTVDFRISPYRPWRSVYIGSAASDQATLAIVARRASALLQPISARLAVQNLTLDNVVVTTPFSPGVPGGIQPGQVTELVIGDAQNAGTLNLTNASLHADGNTRVFLSGTPDTPAQINVLGGSNSLRIPNFVTNPHGLHVDIASNADLTFGGDVGFLENSMLTMASGSTLTLSSGILRLNQSISVANPPLSRIDNAQIEIRRDGTGAALHLGDTMFTDATLDIADTLQIYNSDVANSGFGTATFTGDNVVNLTHDDALFSTAQDPLRVSDGTIRIQSGTTRFNGPGQINAGRFVIDSGILDVSGVGFGAFFRQQGLRFMDIVNGGTFIDGNESLYSTLQFLNIDNGTLRSAQQFGSYAQGAANARYSFDNALIIPNFDDDPARVGRNITFRASQVLFTGSNVVRLAFDPNGQCVPDGNGGCIGNFIFYNDTADFDVGNSPFASFAGFDTVMFLPIANGTYAADIFINGGDNGIYTISRANTDPSLVDVTLPDGSRITPQGYDALPRIPTLQELANAGSNLPANLSYVIVNDPLQDDRIDIVFIERNLGNHPDLAQEYATGETTRIVTEPNTGNISTITVTITPNGDGTAQETTNVTITEPDGDIVSTSNVTVQLDRPTGTANTQNAGNLLSQASQNGANLPHIPYQNLAQQLTSFHPEPYSSFMTVSLEQLDLFRNMALDHASGSTLSAGAREGGSPGRRLWLDSAYVDGSVEGTGRLGSFDYELYNVMIGSDIVSGENGHAGVFVGFGHHVMNEHDLAVQDFSADSYHLGAYGYYRWGDWNVRAMAAYAFGDTSALRRTTLGSISSTNRAEFGNDSFYAGARLQYSGLTKAETIEIVPEIGLGYSYYRQPMLTETGDPAVALTLASADAESVVTSAGVNLALVPDNPVHPIGFVRYEHDWYADRNQFNDVRARLASAPGQALQTFIGQNRGADAIVAGLGLATQPRSNVRVSGGVIYSKTGNGEEWGGGLNIEVDL